MSVTFWSFLSFIAVVTAQGRSKVDLDFLSVFSGKWDNSASVQAGLTNSLMYARFAPVDLPEFRPKTMVYFENAVNGQVFSMFLCEVKKDTCNSNTVLLIPYGFNSGRKYKAGEFDLKDLYKVTPDGLKDYKQCTVKFQTSGNGTFSGPCANCNVDMGQPHPECRLTFDCDVYTLDRPASAKQTGKAVQDVFHLNGTRYPLINAPKDYVSPCDKRYL